jgi:hypothetical protein
MGTYAAGVPYGVATMIGVFGVIVLAIGVLGIVCLSRDSSMTAFGVPPPRCLRELALALCSLLLLGVLPALAITPRVI